MANTETLKSKQMNGIKLSLIWLFTPVCFSLSDCQNEICEKAY